MEIKKVTLIGLGAMGSFFAPKLNKYLGNNFRVIAEGERKERLENKGVTINGINYKFNIITPSIKGDPADLIIIAVKDKDLNQAIEDIKNQVGQDTQIMCVMNGVDSEEKIAKVYGWDKVLYSYMRVSIEMKNQMANYNEELGKVFFGEANNNELSERVLSIKKLFDESGIKYNIPKDMIKGMWYKFMCNIGENLTCALLGIPFGGFQVSEYANAIRIKAMWEVVHIAKKLGIDLGEEEIKKQETTLKKIPFNNKPSTLQDIINGKKTEIEMFAGKVIELGKELNIDTPINFLFYNAIKVYEEKNEGKFNI